MKSVKLLVPLVFVAAILLLGAGCKRSVNETLPGIFNGKLRIGHLVGICMAPLFMAHAMGFFKDEGIEVELHWMPNPGDSVNLLNSGDLQLIHGPFTNTYRGVDSGAKIKIVAGSGNHGLITLATKKSGIRSLDDLAARAGSGVKAGTMRINTLELSFYRLIKDRGLSFKDLDMKYFYDHFSTQAAFVEEEIDVVVHVEPYATMLSDHHHGVRLGSSVDAWGEGSPDCVVSVTSKLLKDYPVSVKKYVRAILRADAYIKEDMMRAAAILDKHKYFRVNKDVLEAALPRQPPGVDLRQGTKAMDKALDDMMELNYLKQRPQNIVDLTLLKEVIKEQV